MKKNHHRKWSDYKKERANKKMANQTYHNFNVNVTSSKDVTIAEISEDLFADDKLLRSVIDASAKRAPGDKANEEIGHKLAVGRALEKAGRALVKEALRESNNV